MNTNKNKIRILSIALLAVVVVVFIAIYFFNHPKINSTPKNITIEVTDGNGKTAQYRLSTEAAYLDEAMDELSANGSGFSYSGSDSKFGVMIEEINGERAVYEKDDAYWSLYVNGEYAQYATSSQPVVDGNVYTWKYEPPE